MAALKAHEEGMPLSLVMARYFAYALFALAAVWVLAFAALSLTMNVGWVYPASYGAAYASATAEALRAQGSFDPASVPTAYRYACFDEDGALRATDMDAPMLDRACEIDRSADAAGVASISGDSGATYLCFGLADGTSCVLASTYMPQFVSRELRDALPNPQNIMLFAGCVGSVAALALVAQRASRVIAHKMAPLTEAAERVAREDLDFSVERGTVREVNEVLSAMERMRGSLKESLEARWRAEQAQRDQVAALAHDLKTPLTVVRANAEYVAEESARLADGSAIDSSLTRDIAAAAADAAAGAERLDAHVRLLIDASRGIAVAGEGGRKAVSCLASRIEEDARALARATACSLEFSAAENVATLEVEGGEDALVRAVMNVVANALEYASSSVSVKLSVSDGFLEICVRDDGEGFSTEALARGCDRFFRGDSSRSGAHYGLGLFAASEEMRLRGGEIELSNAIGETGDVAGACVTLRVPASVISPCAG